MAHIGQLVWCLYEAFLIALLCLMKWCGFGTNSFLLAIGAAGGTLAAQLSELPVGLPEGAATEAPKTQKNEIRCHGLPGP